MANPTSCDKCTKCFGAGQHLCPSCNGRHVLSRKDAYTVVMCKNCMSGRVQCKSCGGTGRQTRLLLNGTSPPTTPRSSPRLSQQQQQQLPSQQQQAQQQQVQTPYGSPTTSKLVSNNGEYSPRGIIYQNLNNNINNSCCNSNSTTTVSNNCNNNNNMMSTSPTTICFGVKNGDKDRIIDSLQVQISSLQEQIRSQQDHISQLMHQNTLLMESNLQLAKLVSEQHSNKPTTTTTTGNTVTTN